MKTIRFWLLSLTAAALLAGCGMPIHPTASGPTAAPSQAMTVAQPSLTPSSAPLAAKVDAAGITIAELDAEVSRYQAAQTSLGNTVSTENARKQVLEDLIDRVLLAQAAEKAGHQVDDASLQSRLDQLAAGVGGQEALKKWESDHGYTDQTFRDSLRREIAAIWQRDQIIAAVPTTADQVHARQILVSDEETAQKVMTKLQSGVDFATYAAMYDPVTGGDLGWFPKGYLSQPEVETAAFSIQPGQYSQPIKTALGVHVIQVIERDAQHPLSPDALRAAQRQALQAWINDARSKSQISVLTP